MSNVLARYSDLVKIADAIREKTELSELMTLQDMKTNAETIQGILPDSETVSFGMDTSMEARNGWIPVEYVEIGGYYNHYGNLTQQSNVYNTGLVDVCNAYAIQFTQSDVKEHIVTFFDENKTLISSKGTKSVDTHIFDIPNNAAYFSVAYLGNERETVNICTISYEEKYSITSVRLNEIAAETQRLANSEEGLDPSQIVQKLHDTVDDDEFMEGTVSHIHNDTVTKIKPYLCYEDKTITSVDCPNVESIGTYSFYNCDNLTDISLPKIDSVPDYAFNSCGKLANIDMSLIKSVGNYGFNGCSPLRSINFPELESVGVHSFRDCSSLEFLDTPKLKTIGDYGFDGCKNLKEVNCPELESVGYMTFQNIGVSHLYLPKLTSVDTASFAYTPSLESIDFPLLTSIPMQCFASSSNIKTINLPSCTSIGRDGLENKQIEDINGDSGTVNLPILKSAGDWSFANCKKLKTVYFPEVTGTGQDAFQNCTALTRMEFDKKVSFGPLSCEGCTALETVILRGDTMSTLYNTGYTAFKNTGITLGTGYIYVPRALVDTYKANSYWSQHASQIRAIEDYPDVCDGKEVVREYVVDTTKEAEYTFDRELVNHTDSYSLKTEYIYESTEKEIDSGRMISLAINTEDKSSIEGLVID